MVLRFIPRYSTGLMEEFGVELEHLETFFLMFSSCLGILSKIKISFPSARDGIASNTVVGWLD